jgi:hypothetical protein
MDECDTAPAVIQGKFAGKDINQSLVAKPNDFIVGKCDLKKERKKQVKEN